MNPLFFKLKTFWLFINGKIKLHQTLFKRLAIAFVLLLILLMISGFFYYNFYFKKDRLIKYAPKETVLYSSLRINGEVKENLLINRLAASFSKEYDLPDIDFSILNPYVAYNAALAIIPNENHFYQFDYLVLFDLRKRPDENILHGQGLYWHYLKNEYFDTDILAISNSPQVIEKVVAVRNQEWPSLASRIGVTLSLNQLKLSNSGKIFIDIDSLSQHFKELNDLRLKMLLASLKIKFPDELYLGVEFKDNKLSFGSQESSELLSEPLLLEAPKDFIANLSTDNAATQFNQITNILSQIDPMYYQQMLKNREYSQGLYNLDWQGDILSLLNDQAQLVVYPNQKYLLALNFSDLADINQKLTKLEEIVSSMFLVNEPRQREKQLPDGTFITQIVRDKSFAFEGFKINNIDLRSLKKGDLEFGYYLDGNRLILANSLTLLNSLINKQGLITLNNDNLSNVSTNFSIYPGIFIDLWPNLANVNTISYAEENGRIWLELK